MINIDQNTNLQPKSKALTIFIVSSVAAILAGLIIVWGILNVFGSFKPAAFYVFSNAASAMQSFSMLFRSDEKLSIESSNRSVNSGELFTLSLDHINKNGTEGEYSINYPCIVGFKLERLYNNKMEELVCGQKVVLGNSRLKNITLKSTLDILESVDLPLTVYYKGADGDIIDMLYAQTLITVVNKNGSNFATVDVTASSTKTQSPLATNVVGSKTEASANNNKIVTTKKIATPASTVPNKNASGTSTVVNSVQKVGNKTEKTLIYYSTGPATSSPNGLIDLEARILELGVIDKNTNVFTASSSPSANVRVAVKFEVINNGTKQSGAWAFNAVLPTFPNYIYIGDYQPSLMPGEKVEFTIGFDSVERKKNGEFVVNIDPNNSVKESIETNNITKLIINPAF